ncbi:hypothetical protein LCGC14_2124270 [marine sediment metagenome]|uniref:Uncharacterized protein n=1 Tax=marine sediment metagenome TaxID=412755 RepID=A0A0F9E3D8_9ZZZZ
MLSATLQEYLDRDTILSGVFEWIIEESPLIHGLSFKPMVGNSLKYNVEIALPTASWIGRNQQLEENTGTFEQRTTDVYTLIQTGYTNKSEIALNATQDPETVDVEKASKAMAHEFEKTMIIGQTSVDSTVNQFKGLLRTAAELESATTTDLDALNNSQVIAGTTSTGALTMNAMDKLFDQIKPGAATLTLMSRAARRKLNTLSRASGSGGLYIAQVDQFGKKMAHYDDVPIMISDWIKDNYIEGSSSVQTISTYDFDAAAVAGTNENTMIFVLQIGEDKCTALQAKAMEHERHTYIEDQHAIANRFSWEVGFACFKKFSFAVLTGINPLD